MDINSKIDTNSLFDVGADPNLHPLLAATSILPSVGVSFAPIQVFAPVDPLRVGYATPLTPVSTSPMISNLLQPTSVSAIATTQMIAAALMTTTARDPLLAPTAKTLAQPAPTALAATVATPPLQPIHSFAIQAGGIVTFNAKSDLDGNPLDLSDDAFVYAGKGFILNGTSILPVQRDAAGNALTDSTGKLRLIDQAVVVAPGYLEVKTNSNTNYTNLNPPQIVATQTIVIPSYTDVKSQELTSRTPAGATTTTFNIQQNPINNATQWTQKFPPAGTAMQPTVVRVTNGGLNIPTGVNLSNYIITVDSGDINFNGTSTLNNVVLVATTGNVNLNQIQTENSSILASGKISANNTAKLGGKTLLANGAGDIYFDKAVTGTTSLQNLRIVSQGKITFNSTAAVRGDFRSVGTFLANDNADIFGTVASLGDIVFNANGTFTYTNTGNSDTTPPTITAKLAIDSGASNSDKITNDRTISGKVTDVSPIASFKAGFDSIPAANWTNVTTSLLADGSFTFTPTQLNQIYGSTIPDGAHTLHLSATDSFGNQSQFDYTFTLYTTVVAPSLQLATASDTGASNSDKITKINTPIITGTGEIGATIKLTEGTVILGQTTVGTDGKWQVATSALANGTHSVIATATDIAGNLSTPSAPLSLVIDTLAPQLTLTNAITTAPLKNNAKLTGTTNGTGSNLASLSYAWDNSATLIPIATNATGGFDQSLNFTGITNGTHILTIAAIDVAGNITSTNYNVTVAVDTAAPVITAKLATDTGSSNTDKITFNPTISGTITDANNVTGFKASFDGINYVDILTQKQADGTFTLAKAQLETVAGRTLVDGNYTLRLIATDEFGNASLGYDAAFTLDTTIAVPANLKLATASDTGASNNDNITKINTPVITGTGEIGATIKIAEGTVIVGQTTVANDGTWQVATSVLTNGTHSLTASAIDLAGNISTTSAPLSLVIDALLPQLTLTTPLDTNPLQNNAKLVGSIDGTGSNLASINYRWDNSTNLIPIGTNASGGFDQGLNFAGISNGTHSIAIIATDVAGNILTSTYNVNVNIDNTAPLVTLQLAIDSGTNTSDKITNNPNITGQVTDPSGLSAVTVSLNAGFTNSANITASLQSDGSFSLDRATLAQLNGSTLPDGNYQVYLRATDTFGNTTAPQTLAFQLLTQATLPTNLQLLASSDTGASNTDKITKNNQPTIQGNGKAGDTIQLFEGTTLLGQTTVGTDSKWQLASTILADGTHNLTAKAIDIAGNISPNASGLTVDIDTVVPNLQLAQQLAGIVLTGTSRLAGQVTDTNINTISYQFDGATPIALPNFAGGTPGTFDTPFDFTGINDGGHNLTVTATDIAGNSVARTYGVTVARGNLLTIALLDDTGISNSDGITSDINVRGQVADRTQISRLEFSLDGNTNYTDLTAALQLDGTFRLLPAQLNSLAGGTLNLGAHSLTVRGVLANGSPVATATLNFTYQSANLDRPSLFLAKASDSGVIGDLVTSAASVDLIAKAVAGSSVTLGMQTLVADINGIATFTGINLTLGGNNFTLTTTNSQGELATSTTTITRTNPDDVILTWNHIALAAIQRENTPPPAAARVLGMVHTAMYDAVNAIEQKYGVYRVDASAPTGADEIAAAAEAAARVLAAIYPNQQAYFSAALESSLLDGATAAASAAGVAVGDTVAANILAWRQQDGSRNPAAFNPTTDIGDWQPDLPNYDGALLPKWGSVTTFGLTSGSQFRPAGDPSLTSAAYTAAFNETKDYGARDGSLRTADNTQSALFWADGNGTFTPAGHWNDIAATAASISGKSILDNARLFAQLNVALADAGIAAWDSKYTFDAWRPITAIRQADKDGNPLTSADPNWVPLINTPPFPEYVSGHSTFSAAAAAVLDKTFGNTFAFNSGSAGLPNVTRSFTSFDAAAAEAGQSRIYGGIHFQFSNQDGLTLGKQIGDYVTANLMLDNSLNPIQVKLTTDTAAFGTTNRDRITTQAGITGKVNLTQPNLKLQVASATGSVVDITSSLDASGNFQLDAAKLTTILGTLTDRSYQLTFKLLDASNAVISTNNLSFILDTTAAQTALNPLTGTVTVHLTGTATDANGGTSGRFKVDGGTWTSFSVQPNGSFDKVLNAQGLTAGSHMVDVELADLAGNVTAQTVGFNVDASNNIYASPATNPGWGRVFGTGFSLAEGNSLITQNSIDVALGGSSKRTLDFDLVANFDKSDVKSFGKDRVAVYLVDNSGNPIALDVTHPGGTPLFSLSETGSEIIPGLVKFDGTHVQIDVSNVSATNGKLVLQLLNLDGDSGSNLTVTNFVDSIDPTGIPGTSVSPAITPVTPGAATVLDSYLATTTAQLLLSNVSLDKATGKYTADLRVQNIGTTTLSQNLAVLLTQLPTGVTVANSSGTHPTGSPYLNFNTAIQPGGLSGGAISDVLRVVINDPSLVAFSFKPVVLQGAAAPLPDLSSLNVLTVKVGDKIDIPLAGELAIKTNVKLPTGAITGDSHLVFTPAPDQIGSYSFTLIARNGGTEVTQNVTLNVVADPITTTRVTGMIADTSQAGLAGVLVELAGYQATTDSSGKFTIVLPDSSAGDTLKVYGQRIQGGGVTYPFIAEKMPLLLGHDIYRGVNNQIDRPIYLPTIDVSTGTTVNPGAETFVTNPQLVGAKVDVAAGSLFDKSGNAFAGIMTITEVPVSLTPAALPDNLHPDLVVTIQPGDMVFNTPARLTLPNRAGYLPGLVMDLWSINPNTGTFDIVGQGRVSADGSAIETISGGIRNSSWHFFLPPPPLDISPDNPLNFDPGKKDPCALSLDFKSEVSAFSGIVSDDRSLVTYQSQGVTRGVNLHYDSGNADVGRIIHVGGSFKNITPTDRLTTKLTLISNGISQTIPGLNPSQLAGLTGGQRMWLLPSNVSQGSIIDSSVQVNLDHLASGVYKYQVDIGIQGVRTWINGGFVTGVVGATSSQQNKVVVINDRDSVFGSGWNVSGLQKLVINDDNSALLIDGDGSYQRFDAPVGNIYQSPSGDFSVLQKLTTGGFLRTTKDGTRYEFNALGLMVAATDRQGNKTQHIYNSAGQIQQIIDPVGLVTNFNYTGNKVTSIVDPAGRITTLDYDLQGDLITVTDPDGTSKNRYGYDGDHRVTSSIDKTGQVKTGTYDGFGRAKTATREDGSIVQIDPLEVQGLKSQQATTNLGSLPTAIVLDPNLASTYVDGNGNTVTNKLDRRGHVIASSDQIGKDTNNTYDANYLVTSKTDANNNVTNYQYDSKGNVISVTESVEQTNLEIGYIKTPATLSLPAPGFPKVLTTGDINNDGYEDIITTADNGKLNILLGDNDGIFSNSYTFDIAPYTQSNVINQLELKDVNNDGKLDLIASLPIDGTGGGYGNFNTATAAILSDPILVFLNQGNGQFASANVLPLAAKSDGFVTGDFNGDGKLDILVRSDITSAKTNNVYPLTLYTGDGTGNFTQAPINITGIDSTSSFTNGFQVAAADFNGDGKTELVFNLYDRLSVYSYTNSGNWSEVYSDSSDFYARRYNFTVGDLNNDGNLDIITDSNGSIDLLLGQNNNNFQLQSFGQRNIYKVANTLKIVDANGDLRPDLVVVNADNSFETYSLDNNGTLLQSEVPIQIRNAGRYLGMADLDRNGSLDLLFDSYSYYNTNNSTLGIVKDYHRSPEQLATSYNFPGYSPKQSVTKSYTYDPVFNQLTSETDELGRQTLYALDPTTGKVLKTTRVVGQLDSAINGQTDDVVTSYTYTSTGQLDIVTDALGHITDYDYDARGNLIKTITAKGTLDQAIEQYQYDLAGNQTTSFDALGHQTKYIYNSSNMLLQTIDALGGTTTYTYDRMGHQTSVTDALGRVTTMTYDSRGRLISTLDAAGGTNTSTYDNNGNLVASTDALGRTTTESYDARGRLIDTTTPDGKVSTNTYDLNNDLIKDINSNGSQTQKYYDSRHRLVWELDPMRNWTIHNYDAANQLTATVDANQHVTRYQYDELGRQIAVIDALTHTTRTEYDKLGNVTATVDANGNRTEYKYDALNRQIRVKDAAGGLTKTSYDKVGDILSVTDVLNRTTSYNYDVLNRQIKITDALGYAITTAYDAVGNVIGSTDALGHTTSYSYDNLNRKIATTDALGKTESSTYNALGNLIATTDKLGQTTTYSYDNLDRLTGITDSLGHTTSNSYDGLGNLTSTTDALGHTTSYNYDALNRKIYTYDANGDITITSYDRVGNVIGIVDSVRNVTTYDYDAAGRLITETNQLGFARNYSYDRVGNRIQSVDRDGRKVTYNYDILNRQTSEQWWSASGIVKTFGSSYDASGHLLSSIAPDSSYSYSYDAVDRVTSIDNTGTVGVPAVKFNYTYDAVGNLLTVNDSINGTSAGITGYSYDLLNRVTKLTQGGTGVQSKRVDMAYNAVNQLTSLSRYSGVNSVVDTSYTYDLNQRLIQLSHKKGVSTVASYDYSYDAADKLASTVSSVDGTSSYSYDSTNQLTGASHTSQTNEAYSYDANGNRTNAGYGTGTNNQLLNDGTYNYVYDGEGNRTRRTEISTGKVTEYVWDYRNRLASVLFKDALGSVTKTIDYLYDGNNQRIGKRIDGAVVERYVIDRNQIALVFDGAGVETHRYLYGTQVDQVLADETATGMVWALADNQGTVKDLVDNNGVVVNHITYDSFGKVVAQSNPSVEFRYGYTGREQDAETGLDYYRARYYDVANGRFISEDPIGFEGEDSNLTRYVGNNSINYTDPSGLITFLIPGKQGDLGDLPLNIMTTPGRRYGVVSLKNPELSILERIFSGNDFNAQVDAAEKLVSIFAVLGNGLVNLGKDEPIILVAHSNGNLALQPIISVLKNTQLLPKGFGDTCPNEKPRKLEIDVMQLDGLGVPRPQADKVVTIGSNNKFGQGSTGIDKQIDIANANFYRADIRALAGVSHNGLLRDVEVLRRAQAFARFRF
jgi:RHS repeat-associated protein